jgi:pilus assembly protein CpaB
MNRQSRTLVVIVVAVAAASVASFAVYKAITRMPVREVEIATRHAVVAAAAMPMGARLTRDSVKLVDWPERTPLPDGFTDVNAVVDRGLVASVGENEPITERKLAPKEAGAGLPPAIPPGMRAMSVKVNEVIGVAGFVVPGTKVDVLVTLRQKGESYSRAVVENAQVLTAGTKYDQENPKKDGKPTPSTVVTLMVTPQDAERIALAQTEGQLMLALRNPLDTSSVETHGVRTAGLFGGSAPEAPATGAPAARPVRKSAPVAPVAPAVEATPRSSIYTVEAIRAAKRTEEVVR